MKKKRVIVDTNVLLDQPEILDNENYEFIIPFVVLQELDNLKRKPHLKVSAQLAIKKINENSDNVVIAGKLESKNNDDEILNSSTGLADTIFTQDVAMKVKARAKGLDVVDLDDFEPKKYTGYHVIDLFALNGEGTELCKFMCGDGSPKRKLSIPVDLVKPLLPVEPHPSEYLVIKGPLNQKGNVFELIYRFDEESGTYKRRGQDSLKVSDSVTFKPFDIAQEIALISAIDMNVPATIIDGAVGTGKTLIAVAAALYLKKKHNLRNIFITRAPLGIDSRFNIGYLPGDVNEKMNPWIGGILSNLEFLYKEGAKTVFEENFVHFPVNMAQGYSIHDSVIIVDEVQLLSRDVLKQVISRVAKNSKIILLGDENQAYNIIPKSELGLRKLKKILPQKGIEYILLDKIYRGRLAEISMML